jgi:hypothetical protein
MTINNQTTRLFRHGMFAAAMLVLAAPAALADPPGYYFQDFEQSSPVATTAPVAPDQRDAASREPGAVSAVKTDDPRNASSQADQARVEAERNSADAGRYPSGIAAH